MKTFRLKDADIKPLAEGYGECLATDVLTVDGQPIGYMYREVPDLPGDSGWRFLSGYETEDYMQNPDNMAIFDVNTIANHDPAIIPYLDAPVGTELERDGDIFIEYAN